LPFTTGAHLLLGQSVAVLAVHGFQTENILVAQLGDGTINHGSALRATAYFESRLWSEPRIRVLAHETQRLPDARVGNQAEIRGLFQLHRQAQSQRAIKYRVTSRVRKVR